MPAARAPRPYRTARERVAHRSLTRHRRRSSGCSSLLIGLIVLLFLVSAVVVAIAHLGTQSLRAIEMDRPDRLVADDSRGAMPPHTLPDTMRDSFTMLLLGVDLREGEIDYGVRSDTLIVVHVNPREGWASMLSIPRDTVVNIPDLSQQKINVAYTHGYLNAAEMYGFGTDPAAAGGALAAETVENFLNIKIDYIAQVDFYGFERIVDTVGGVTIDIMQPLLDSEYPAGNYGFERIYIPAGLQVLDGRTALQYARSRHGSSDFDRSCRQQRVLRALLRQVRQRGLLDQIELLPQLVRDMEQSVATTLPVSDPNVVYGLADFARNLEPDRLLQLSINPDTTRIVAERGSDIYWNEEDIARLVERMLAGPQTPSEPQPVWIQVLNATSVPGLAGHMTTHLSRQGFALIEPNDALQPYDTTMIIDYSDQPEVRQHMADLLKLPPSQVFVQPTGTMSIPPAGTDIVVVLGNDYEAYWEPPTEEAPSTTPDFATPLPAVPPPAEPTESLFQGCPVDF